MYVDYETYVANGGTASEQDITPKLATASDNVDALTFYRIRRKGWDALTEFQREQLERAIVVQAEFLYENADAVESAMEEYSINGVTMKFGNKALYSIESGIPINNVALTLIQSTGLASRMATYSEVEPCYFQDL